MSPLICIIVVCCCLAIHAFFAGCEMSIISCDRIKMRHRAARGDRRAMIIQNMLDVPEKFLGITLVGINCVVVLGATFMDLFINRGVISVLIMWPLVLIIGEILPKSLARQYPNRMSLVLARPFLAFYYILFPMVVVASRIGDVISRLVGSGGQKGIPFVTREELKLLLAESEKAPLDTDERRMIREIFDFGETAIKSVMVPLVNVVAAPDTSRVSDIVALMRESAYSRIPIYRERIDEIVGTIRVSDVLGMANDMPIKPLIRPAYIIPDAKPIEDVLKEFQVGGRQMAIVVDEYGGVAGIVTLEDIIEEVVGEIHDEYDDEEEKEWVEKEGAVILDGEMRIEDFNEEFDADLPDDEAETVAGFIVARLDRIPSVGERVVHGGIVLEVMGATDRKVSKLRFSRNPGVSGGASI